MKTFLLKFKFILLFAILISSTSMAQMPATGLNFDGSNDYVDLGNITATNFGTNDFTIELWVKTNVNPTKSMAVISKRFICNVDNFWNINISPGGTFVFEAIDPGTGSLNLNSATPIVDGNWHHIAITRNGTALTLYLNGNIENAVTPAVIQNLSNAYNVHLGKNQCSDEPWGRYFEGSMDEVRIWNYSRSQQEIMDDLVHELDGVDQGLIAYYNFNQGIVGVNNTGENTLIDNQTLGVNNGTLVNFALNGPTSNWSEGSSVMPIPGVPISNWAIVMSFFLIISVILVKYLRLF